MTFLKGAVLGYFLPIFVRCNFFIVLIFFENCSVLWKDWAVFKKYKNVKKIAIFELFWSIFQFFENCWMSVFSRNLFVDILNYTLTVTRVKTYALLPCGVFYGSLWICFLRICQYFSRNFAQAFILLLLRSQNQKKNYDTLPTPWDRFLVSLGSF